MGLGHPKDHEAHMRKQESKATRSDPARAVAFSDAIIAIVITLPER